MIKAEKLRRLAWAIEKLASAALSVADVRRAVADVETRVFDGETLSRELSKLETTVDRLTKSAEALHGILNHIDKQYPDDTPESPDRKPMYKCEHCEQYTDDDDQATTVTVDGFVYHASCWKEVNNT